MSEATTTAAQQLAEFTPTIPSSLEERYELFQARVLFTSPGEANRVMGCALALCWPLLRGHLAAREILFHGDVREYGRQAIDALLSDDGPPTRAAILAAGKQAYALIEPSLFPVLEAAKKPEGFSGPAGGSAESNSLSSGSGAESQGGSGLSIPALPPSSSPTSG